MKYEKYNKIISVLPDERILYVGKKHFLFYVTELFIPVFFAIIGALVVWKINHAIAFWSGLVVILFSVLAFYKIRVDYHYDVMIVTNRRIICRDSHLIGHTETTLEYESVTAVKPDQKGILAFLFGYGDIFIETKSAALGNIFFKRMTKHKDVAHKIAVYMDKFGKSSDTKTIEPEETAKVTTI